MLTPLLVADSLISDCVSLISHDTLFHAIFEARTHTERQVFVVCLASEYSRTRDDARRGGFRDGQGHPDF